MGRREGAVDPAAQRLQWITARTGGVFVDLGGVAAPCGSAL
jgi:hypothetical protein